MHVSHSDTLGIRGQKLAKSGNGKSQSQTWKKAQVHDCPINRVTLRYAILSAIVFIIQRTARSVSFGAGLPYNSRE